MCREREAGTLLAAASQSLDDLPGATGCVRFRECATEVRVGWLNAGGDGLVVTAHVDEGVGAQVRFWCDARQWADWLAPSLPVPSWEALPPAWQACAASLTLVVGDGGNESGGESGGASGRNDEDASFGTQHALNAHGVTSSHVPTISWPRAVSITSESMETAWRVGMMLERDGHRLALMYLDGPMSWLRERCQQATPCESLLDPAGLPQRHCLLAAGWTALPASQCDRLRSADAVLLDVTADITTGEHWLVDGDYAIAMRDGRPTARHVVHFDTLDARREDHGPRDGSGNSHDNNNGNGEPTCARLFAVVTERSFPIPWLNAWRSGNAVLPETTVSSSTVPEGRITLWRDGVPWASGRLLSFGDERLAVQIEREPTVCDADVEMSADMSADVSASTTRDTTRDRTSDPISGGDPMGVYCATT